MEICTTGIKACPGWKIGFSGSQGLQHSAWKWKPAISGRQSPEGRVMPVESLMKVKLSKRILPRS
jgi:hypothetical protein